MYSRFLEDSHRHRDRDFEEVPTPRLENMNPSPSPSASPSSSSSSPFYSSSFAATAQTTAAAAPVPSTSTSTRLQTTTTRLEIKLPSGLPQLLEILAREVIRNQPENILEYLASLSEELLEKRDGETIRDKAGAGNEVPTEKVDVESQAAVKIQASYRGYKTRKDLHKAKDTSKEVEALVEIPTIEAPADKIQTVEDDEVIAATIPAPLRTICETQSFIAVEDEAATKIQSGVRGFLTRRRLNAQRSLNNNNSIDDIQLASASAPTSPPEPDEHDLAVERILKEYGSRPLPSFRDNGHKIESRTTSLEMHVQELEAELASLSSESGRENQELSVDKSDASASIPLEEAEPETAVASELPEETVEVKHEASAITSAEPEPVLKPQLSIGSQTKSFDETDKSVKSVTILEPERMTEPQRETETESEVSESDASHNEDSDGEQSYTVNPLGGVTADMPDKAVTEDCVQLINAVVIEVESIVKSMEGTDKVVVPQASEQEPESLDENASKDDSPSESTSAHDVIQVEISSTGETHEDEEEDGSKKDRRSPKHEPVTIPAVVAKEDSVESVPLRNRSSRDRVPSEEKAPEAPVVVRRSKRNTSNTETKYRSGFVEVNPADHEAVQKSFDKINMPHIDESDLDEEIEHEVMNNAAAKIQAGFRGYKARRTLNQAKASATCIQANFRGYKARRKIEQEKKAVVKIQATVRGFLARRRVAKAKLATQSKRRKSSTGFKLQRRRSSTLNAAAIRIQSAYRGYTVRKNYKELRQNSTSPIDLRIEDVGAAEGEM